MYSYERIFQSNFNQLIEMFFELNLRNKRWLLCFSYSPHKNQVIIHSSHISQTLDANHSNYDRYILVGDLNA